jgi:hypothetical protein
VAVYQKVVDHCEDLLEGDVDQARGGIWYGAEVKKNDSK